MTTPTMVGPLCNCGCGEHLPYGSVRKYKRGHRQRVNRAVSAALDAELGIPSDNGYQFSRERTEPERIDAWDVPEFSLTDDGAGFTIEDAAQYAEKDPETDIWATGDNGEKVQVTRGVQKDVEAKLLFMLATPGNLLSMIDPVCGTALVDNSTKIAKSLTPILCQSAGVVAWFQRTSNVMLYVNFAMACWPLLATIWSHHFAAHTETVPNPMNGQMDINPNMYGVS